MVLREDEIKQQAGEILGQLTLKEKVSLLSGADVWHTVAIERVGLPAIRMADGPNGFRSSESEPSTVFPTGVAMGATWNPDLIGEAARAMAREARAGGVHVLLGPNINIQRTPLGGRNFETYSEDPVLAGALSIAFVKGAQKEGVGASVKHYAANNQEYERRRQSSNMDPRTLREVYLPAFERTVKEARPWTIMAAYNRVNGTHMSEHPEMLTEILRGDWGFDGAVVSDWGATHSTASVPAGMDIEMPGPARALGQKLVDAVEAGEIAEEAVDRAARRVIELALKGAKARGRAEINTPAHQEIACRVVEEAIVLLKNEGGILPLDPSVKKIAVIGPNADQPVIQGGGSAHAVPFREITALDGLRAELGDHVELIHAPGVENEPVVPIVDRRLLSPNENRSEPGLRARYFASADGTGPVIRDQTDAYLQKFGFPDDVMAAGQGTFSAVWDGWLWPDRDGAYELVVEYAARAGTAAEILIDGEVIAGPEGETEPILFVDVIKMTRAIGRISLKAGSQHRIEVRHGTSSDRYGLFRVGLRKPAGTIDEAVAAAKAADVALVFVGVSRSTDGEGYDREGLDLWGDQNELVEAVAAANPNTVVVMHNGAPMALPWLDRVKGLMTVWLPGQEGGHAIARALTGAVNPSGKLPHTMPKRIEDNPTYPYYPGDLETDYGEGLFVGYRHYDANGIEPLFPFGFGLNYMNAVFDEIRGPASVSADEEFEVYVELTNESRVTGHEVVQLYIEPLNPPVTRPVRELKAFEKVRLRENETRRVIFRLKPRDFATWDEVKHGWTVAPGRYVLHAGNSSRHLPLRHVLELR